MAWQLLTNIADDSEYLASLLQYRNEGRTKMTPESQIIIGLFALVVISLRVYFRLMALYR